MIVYPLFLYLRHRYRVWRTRSRTTAQPLPAVRSTVGMRSLCPICAGNSCSNCTGGWV